MQESYGIPSPTATPCPLCGGPRILTDSYGALVLVPLGELWRYPPDQSSNLIALVCLSCGAVQLFAKWPRSLITSPSSEP
jgi:hypothetical protein